MPKDIQKENYNSKVLVEMWADFIDWKKRRKGENGFLLKKLKEYKCRTVFDACLGDGADSIYLLQNKFQVTSNDLDKLFIREAQVNARKYKVRLKVTKYDWRDLSKHFSDNSFDAVLCLGNSLTYLFKKADRKKTVKNFLHIVKKGGIVIIDERNYQYMLDNRKEILEKGIFKYSAKYVYCGNKVHGKPIEISNSNVRIEYSDDRTDNKGYLTLYAFKKGELLSLLKDSGFKEIIQYSDYKKGYNKNADFYQYVCTK